MHDHKFHDPADSPLASFMFDYSALDMLNDKLKQQLLEGRDCAKMVMGFIEDVIRQKLGAFLMGVCEFLLQSGNPKTKLEELMFACGNHTEIESTLEEIGARNSISRQAVSKGVKELQASRGLPHVRTQKTETACRTYRAKNKRNYKKSTKGSAK